MVYDWRNASGATLATAGRKPHAEPNSASSNITPVEAEVEQAIQFDEFEGGNQDSGEDKRSEDNDSVGIIDEAEEHLLHVGHSSNPHGVAECVVNERDEEEAGG